MNAINRFLTLDQMRKPEELSWAEHKILDDHARTCRPCSILGGIVCPKMIELVVAVGAKRGDTE
jgi:hypothetical protein